MKTLYTFSSIAFAALAAAGLSRAAEPGCNAEPSCAAQACCDPGTCCPKCGCHEGLIPVCHSYCTTKKVVKYHYCCKCEDLCIPGHSPCCPKCGDGCCDQGCAANGGCGNCGCEESKCNCMVREVHKLVKIPYTVEVPVRKCTVTWVCPTCGCNCGCSEGQAAPAPAVPMPAAPSAPGKSASTPPTSPAPSENPSTADFRLSPAS